MPRCLRLREVNEVHRIVREACEVGGDAVGWRQHLLGRMQSLMGAAISTCHALRLPLDPRRFRPDVLVFVDPDPQWLKYIAHADVSPDPHTISIVPRLGEGFHETTEQLCGGRDCWHRSAFFNDVMRASRYDDNLVSVVPLHQRGYSSVIGFARGLRDQPFNGRERRLVKLLHDELASLWLSPPLTPEPDWRRRLTPRLRDVLAALLEGLSEKEVARRLGLRRTTVHNHVERLYRALEVNSRGELLAKARPPAEFRPRLVPQSRSLTT